MDIINVVEKLEEIEKKYDLFDVAESLKQEYAITSSKELKKVLQETTQKLRELKIGVIGRVKAGKSSLINSLIFDGENILPKAATPMTAALTTIKHSDEFGAEIEFYEAEDIEILKEKYEEYKQRFDALFQKYLSETKDEEKANKRAFRELKNTQIFAYYEQYEKIKDSNIKLEQLNKEIKASSFNELNDKLADYVGSSGKYMPFTKAVHLKINKKELQGIQIIDTPGVNDPVVSREERTKELLKYCDVIFIVSPSGQFLNSDDLSLIDRISSKEGISEIYLIASQVDNQLYGSEKRDNLYESLEVISEKLTNQAKQTFEEDISLQTSVVYEFIKKNKVLTTSAIAYSLYKKFDTKNFDENETHVLGMLQRFYSEYFSQNAKENLLKLSNIPTLKNLLDDVRERKTEILEKKIQEFESTQLNSILEYKKALIKEITNRINRIKESNIEDIKSRYENLEQMKQKASVIINEEFSDLVEDFEISAKNYLFSELSKFFSNTKEDIKSSEDTKTETYQTTTKVEKEGFLPWLGRKLGVGGYEEKVETHTNTYTIARAGIVRNALEGLTDNIEVSIETSLREYISKFRKNLFKHLVGVLRENIGDENLDVYTISSVLRKVINSVEIPEISYRDTFPDSLKRSGTLEGYEAEEFINEANEYVSSLQARVQNDIKEYLNNLNKELLSFNIAENIFKKYDEEIQKLQKEVQED